MLAEDHAELTGVVDVDDHGGRGHDGLGLRPAVRDLEPADVVTLGESRPVGSAQRACGSLDDHQDLTGDLAVLGQDVAGSKPDLGPRPLDRPQLLRGAAGEDLAVDREAFPRGLQPKRDLTCGVCPGLRPTDQLFEIALQGVLPGGAAS